MNPHTYGHLIFDKGAKTIWLKKTAFSKIGAGSMDSQHVKECKFIHSYLLYKAQVHVDQGPPHKTRYTETNRKWGRASSTRAHGKIS